MSVTAPAFADIFRPAYLEVRELDGDRYAVTWRVPAQDPATRLALHVVFPEGTRSVTGNLGPFKGGSLYPAVQAGLPIVPLSIAGSRHVMRKGRLMTCPGEVELVVHEPILTEAAAEPDIRAVRKLATRVRDIIAPVVEAEAARGLPS